MLDCTTRVVFLQQSSVVTPKHQELEHQIQEIYAIQGICYVSFHPKLKIRMIPTIIAFAWNSLVRDHSQSMTQLLALAQNAQMKK